MCGLCGVLAPREHWTDGGQSGEGLKGRRVAETRRRARLVFIVQGLKPEDIEASLLAFNGLANSVAA